MVGSKLLLSQQNDQLDRCQIGHGSFMYLSVLLLTAFSGKLPRRSGSSQTVGPGRASNRFKVDG